MPNPVDGYAETLRAAEAVSDFLVETLEVKYKKAIANLKDDGNESLATHQPPAEHSKQIKTVNPTNETIATAHATPAGPKEV